MALSPESVSELTADRDGWRKATARTAEELLAVAVENTELRDALAVTAGTVADAIKLIQKLIQDCWDLENELADARLEAAANEFNAAVVTVHPDDEPERTGTIVLAGSEIVFQKVGDEWLTPGSDEIWEWFEIAQLAVPLHALFVPSGGAA